MTKSFTLIFGKYYCDEIQEPTKSLNYICFNIYVNKNINSYILLIMTGADRSKRIPAMRAAICETFPEPNRRLLQR